jgi:uncharacterized protein YecE (DUF72 family)
MVSSGPTTAITADFVHLRLHGTETRYSGVYSEDALDEWVARILAWRRSGPSANARLIAPDLLARNVRRRVKLFRQRCKNHSPFCDAQRLT